MLNLTGGPRPDTLEMVLPGTEFGLRLAKVLRTLSREDAAATVGEVAAGRFARCVLPWVPRMQGAGRADIIQRWREAAEGEPDLRRRCDYGGPALVFAAAAKRLDVWKRGLEGWNVQTCEIVEEWKADAVRANVIRILEVRFKGRLPTDLEASLRAEPNLQRLNRLVEAAATAGSLDEFRSALKSV